jgi:D-serine deaminase-like pyridoxal phosphate-dependent protein
VTRELAEVETPALLVDLDALERNLGEMAELARAAGVALRPHWKTHKCPEIARRQVALGAAGGTVAKPSEAEAFLDAGFDDVLIATPVVDPAKIDHLIERGRQAKVAVLVESPEGADRWDEGARRAGVRIPVMLEVDSGMGRTGVAPGSAAVELAREVTARRGLRLLGVMTHAGHAYEAGSAEQVAGIGHAEGQRLVETAGAIRAAGIECTVVSVGSTPTVRHSARVPGVTEIRPGNYVFHDRTQVGLGVVGEERCALTVLATVVARPSADRIVVDAGSKTLSSDRARGGAEGFGHVARRPELRVVRVWEEHGLIDAGGAAAAGFRVGDRVRILPNHACVTVNLHEKLVAVRGESVEGVWSIAARGRVA